MSLFRFAGAGTQTLLHCQQDEGSRGATSALDGSYLEANVVMNVCQQLATCLRLLL